MAPKALPSRSAGRATPGEDAVTVAYQLETFFKPLLIGYGKRESRRRAATKL
jgi:hypothetical protein